MREICKPCREEHSHAVTLYIPHRESSTSKRERRCYMVLHRSPISIKPEATNKRYPLTFLPPTSPTHKSAVKRRLSTRLVLANHAGDTLEIEQGKETNIPMGLWYSAPHAYSSARQKQSITKRQEKKTSANHSVFRPLSRSSRCLTR